MPDRYSANRRLPPAGIAPCPSANTPMRTAHVITRLIIGGAQENTLFNVDDQHHLFGDDVCLITGPGVGPEGSLEQQARNRGLNLIVLPELIRSLNPLQDLR
ncbi:MAG: hypothetical protein ACK5YO_21495, partial [Planctomyces sp.]